MFCSSSGFLLSLMGHSCFKEFLWDGFAFSQLFFLGFMAMGKCSLVALYKMITSCFVLFVLVGSCLHVSCGFFLF